MNCPKCNAEVEDGLLFCHVCGEELKDVFKTGKKIVKAEESQKPEDEKVEAEAVEEEKAEPVTEETQETTVEAEIVQEQSEEKEADSEEISDEISTDEAPQPEAPEIEDKEENEAQEIEEAADIAEKEEAETEAEEKPVTEEDSEEKNEEESESEAEEAEPEKKETSDSKEENEADSDQAENSENEEADAAEEIEEKAENSKLKNKKLRKEQKKESKKVKTYTVSVKAIVIVCAVVMAALAVVSKTTPIFENDSKDMAMVLSGMNETQKAGFEEHISKFTVLFENGYDSKKLVFDDIVSLINPSVENGLYNSFYSKPSIVTETSDPAGRFISNGSGIGYYVVDAKDISKIAQSLSLKNLNDINTYNCYFLDSKYYFGAQSSFASDAKYDVKVADSKKTNDGSYYITCNLFKSGSEEAERQIFVLASAEETENGFEWTISKISNEALYNPLGSKIEEKTKEDSVSYIMKRQTIEAKTSDGKVFEKFVIEYPSFESGLTVGDTITNKYKELISDYKKQAENADKAYKKYIESGADEAALPFYTHIITSVKHNGDGLVSIVERKTVYNADSVLSVGTTDTGKELFFPVTSYEAHSFEIESGEFLKKDKLLSKDYQQSQQTLYEKWLGWEPAQDDLYPVHPTDTNSVGQAIYTSAWYVTPGMINFLYQRDDGALDVVSIEVQKETDENAKTTESETSVN